MFELDMARGWEPVPGTEGISQKPLSGNFDEANQTGYRTRCVRVAPGGKTQEPFVHAYWEEVFVLEGTLTSKPDGTSVSAPAYVIRPPGTPHGPIVSEEGCLLIELQYFSDRSTGMRDYLDAMAPNKVSDTN
jgi:quercetin dioxygenase-like cupin family protein